MRKHAALAVLVGLVSSATGLAFAAAPGNNVAGALFDNPSRLGFASFSTFVTDADVTMPAISDLQSLSSRWDPETRTLDLTMDLSTAAGAQAGADLLNTVLGSVSGATADAAVGLSVWHIGLGTVVRTEGASASDIVVEASSPPGGDYTGYGAVSATARARADAVATIGLPIGDSFAVGLAGKFVDSEFMSLSATRAAGVADPTIAHTYDRGQGFLFDIGASYRNSLLQAGVALKDLGSLTWKAQPWTLATGGTTVAVVHPTEAHVAGSLAVSPIDQLTLSADYDQALVGLAQVKLGAEFRPLSFLKLRAGTTTGPAVDAPIYEVGLGFTAFAVGLDLGAAVSNGAFAGAELRFDVGF